MPRSLLSATSTAYEEKCPAPFVEAGQREVKIGLEIQLHAQLQHAVRLSDGDDRCRAWQRGRYAASLAEQRVAHTWCSRTGVSRVVEVGMIQNVKSFGTELKVEPLCQLKVLHHAGIQVPEVRSLRQVATAPRLPRFRDAEICRRADHVTAVHIGI